MGTLKIKEVVVRDRGYVYSTFLVEGKDNQGNRIRLKAKDRAAAIALKNETEIDLANSDLKVRTTVTRLTTDQIQEAERAMATLNGKGSLLQAAEYFVENFRLPSSSNKLSSSADAFLLERQKPRSSFYVRPRSMKQCRSVWNQFRAFVSVHHGGDIPVHEISRAIVVGFLERTDDPKTFNNWHSELNRFFEYCLDPDRMWVTQNPLAQIRRARVGETPPPEVLPLQTVKDLLAYVETFAGTSKRKPGTPGQLVRYFALALFAGIRTDDDGEMVKIARSPDAFSRIIDLKRKVIRIPPHISKTGTLRPIKIRPCLRAWLTAFPGPILPVNHDKDIAHVREKFGVGRDVLRHTWYSMHVMAFKSVGEAAIEGGSTDAIVRKHYLNMAHHTEKEAKVFWNIIPKKRGDHHAVTEIAEDPAATSRPVPLS